MAIDRLPEFTVDFNRVITDPARNLTQAVQLGYESQYPILRDLAEKARVLVVMPGELWAEAEATVRTDARGRYWYAELCGPVHYYHDAGDEGNEQTSSPPSPAPFEP